MLTAAGGLAGLALAGCGIQAADQKNPLLSAGKLLVIHDKDGHIGSATQLTQPPVPKGMNGIAKIGAEHAKKVNKHNEKMGYLIAELDVPPSHYQKPLHHVLTQLHVDVRNRKLIAKPNK